MNCPRCQSELIVVEYHAVELDYCPECEGLWFDSGEMALVATQMSGSQCDLLPQERAETKETRLKCPECHKAMDKRLLGATDPVIADVCRLCDGLWLDHGELEQVVAGMHPSGETDTPIIGYLRNTFRPGLEEKSSRTPGQTSGESSN